MKQIISIASVVLALVLFAVLQVNSSDAPVELVADHGSTIITSEQVTFTRDGIEFVGELTYPTNLDAQAVVVFVHGSEQFSATEHYTFADGFARRGIATLVFDKRGTGGSGGDYTFGLSTLASDVVAAVESLADLPQVASLPVGLVAISQGGWVAPLAALESPSIRFMVLDSGSALSQQETDRWVTEQWMLRQGASASDIANAGPVMDAVYGTLACSFRCRWMELESAKQEAAGQPWFALLSQSQTNVGFVLGMSQAQLIEMFDGMGGGETNEEFRQDPLAILARVNASSIWLLGDQDELVPTAQSAERLNALAGSSDARIEVLILPGEGHSIISRTASQQNWELLDSMFSFIGSETR